MQASFRYDYLSANAPRPGAGIAHAVACMANSPFRPGLPVLPELAGSHLPVALHLDCEYGAGDLAAFLSATGGFRQVVATSRAAAAPREILPDVVYLSTSNDHELARAFCSATVAVSTCACRRCGRQLAKALACGTPVAALPGKGARNVIGPEGRGALGDLPMTIGATGADLEAAVRRAARLDRVAIAVHGARLLARSAPPFATERLLPETRVEVLHAA